MLLLSLQMLLQQWAQVYYDSVSDVQLAFLFHQGSLTLSQYPKLAQPSPDNQVALTRWYCWK